ncbi:uncharacterized mitochondrial protein AtMg00810-like [Ziziphus jujuba]|uniref:Uncharacterized mitochondrial protein AtMg00810-like n=1 Tax=Ziziphus jujuba TaxID=326968 RepID=A0ABM4A513_ZIZJJ|nr:uncharacterized mitochondrial protein AtMg00810-like [Ziziphus jujuba]
MEITKIKMKGNRSFPVAWKYTSEVAMKPQVDISWIWHKRFGHSHLNNLKILQQKNMMHDLPTIEDINGNNEKMIEEFKKEMLKTFEMTYLGLMRYFLGIETYQSTPLDNCQTMKKEGGSPPANSSAFRSLIGSILYLTTTKPDIVYATSLLSRFMQNPTQVHYGVAKRILRYLQGTKYYGIWYRPTSNSQLLGFTDSDWSGSAVDMRSTSSYVFTIGLGIFSCASKKQATVTQSSA